MITTATTTDLSADRRKLAVVSRRIRNHKDDFTARREVMLRLRDEHGLSQAEIARIAKVTPMAVSLVLNEKD